MRKLLTFTFIILSYNIYLLILPLIIFLVSLSLSSVAIIDILPWIYGPFIVLSPVLTLVLGYLIAKETTAPISWFAPMMMNLIGSTPFLLLYLLISSLWNPLDYFFIIFFPILFGLLATFAAFLDTSLQQFFEHKR